ncbi:MAG TPA: monofunctional biosynthetic peptidoglycan transglycosylase [Blastocatellia bacterium]|jgi:monofunctional biosynthetic peptidoglycan transglycosylase|nr:monofunctional biosynthetic peptidoglycan transglycosylase [Blastocatellia bacterium]
MGLVLTTFIIGLPLYLIAEFVRRRREARRRSAGGGYESALLESSARIDSTERAEDSATMRLPPWWRVWCRRGLGGLLLVALILQCIAVIRIIRLKKTNPTTTAFIEDRLIESGRKGLEQSWVSYQDISPMLVRAVIAGEDWRFVNHAGVDWRALLTAAEDDWDSKSLSKGGSTISQQLAKNLFLSSSKNPIRKGYEILLAYEMEAILGKHRILELYLNVVEWGDGLYGAEAAARHYFNTSAASLNREQAAFLAAILPNPRDTYNPNKNGALVHTRLDWIMSLMDYVEILDKN